MKELRLTDIVEEGVQTATLNAGNYFEMGSDYTVGVMVYYKYTGEGAVIYLTKQQTIELRDYLNTILEENKENG